MSRLLKCAALSDIVVVYYGLQIPADQVAAIRAPLLLHYAELDERSGIDLPRT